MDVDVEVVSGRLTGGELPELDKLRSSAGRGLRLSRECSL